MSTANTRTEQVTCPRCQIAVAFPVEYVRQIERVDLPICAHLVPSTETKIVCPLCGELAFDYIAPEPFTGGVGQFVVAGAKRVPWQDSQRGTGRTLRMCQIANCAIQRGESVAIIAYEKEVGRLRSEPYCLDLGVWVLPRNSARAMMYFQSGRLEGWQGIVLVDHYVWELRRQEGHLRMPPYVDIQETIEAPEVPENWEGMPKGDDWLVVADMFADIGDTRNEALARLHHSRIQYQR